MWFEPTKYGMMWKNIINIKDNMYNVKNSAGCKSYVKKPIIMMFLIGKNVYFLNIFVIL